jgi:hypothetical protein
MKSVKKRIREVARRSDVVLCRSGRMMASRKQPGIGRSRPDVPVWEVPCALAVQVVAFISMCFRTLRFSICQSAVGGAVPVNEVMRCLMYHRYYGEPELARLTFAGLPEEVKLRLTTVDYSRAEEVCPQKLAIAALMRQAAEILA